MRVICLGTSGSLPTLHRSLPSIAILRKTELFLFDCGEGTQRQMMSAKIGFCRKAKIFVTHMHGDHVLGLPGLFQTMALLERKHPLEIYGPKGIRKFVDCISNTVQFGLTYQININEVGEGVVCQESEYEIHAAWAEHGVPSLAYSLIENERPGKFHVNKARSLGVPEGALWSELQHGHEIKLKNGKTITPIQVMGTPRPGIKLVYTGDTEPSERILELSKNADLLIHDSTLDDDLIEKARESGHSTPSQAAKIAKAAKVKWLLLTHVSARYDDRELLFEQAKKIFPRVRVAEDLMEFNITYSDSV